jgi:hypothetical protein
MPTKRTIQQLYDFFASGQPARSITPDRVQDTILSLRPGFGRLSLSQSVETNIATVNVYQKLAGVTVLGEGAFTFTMPANGRLQCECPIPSRLEVEAVISLTNGSQKEFELAFAKGNGDDAASLLSHTVQGVRFGPGGGTVEVKLMGDFTQAPGDYVEIWARNITDATNITATRLYMRASTWVL